MKKIVLFFFLLLSFCAEAQDSSRLRISLLTCTPGQELYSTFGHSAMRVIDSNAVTDLVYNYGTFDFSDPNFYSKFVRGKLMYFESIEQTTDFIWAYQQENRGITEQVLLLTGSEKQALRQALNTGLKEENRYYKYDFFLDNCTTRLRDLLEKNKDSIGHLPAVMPTNYTFRNAIHKYLDAGKMYWSKLGIDLLLGSPTDAVMTVRQQQFLPDNLMIALDKNKVPVVQQTLPLYKANPLPEGKDLFTPMNVSVALLVLVVLLSFFRKKDIPGIAYRWLSAMLLLVSGLLGILFLFMMFGTDHSMTKANYNLLWALPTHAIAAFFLHTQKKWLKSYLFVTVVVLIASLLFFNWLPQQLNTALVPIMLLLAWICIIKIRDITTQQKLS